jgi:predicted lipid-binding transport protein (Tim44 family)
MADGSVVAGAQGFMQGFMGGGAGGLAGATPYGAMIQGAVQLGSEALKPVATTSDLNWTGSFDNGGDFNLNIGSGQQSATGRTNTSTPAAAQVARAAGQSVGSLLGNPLFVVLVGVGLFLYLKHK